MGDTIINSISRGIFPDNARVDSVSPVVKQSNDKNKVLNFWPVSVLNVFPKIYQAVTKSQLTLVLNNIFSPHIAAYRESYNTTFLQTQHVYSTLKRHGNVRFHVVLTWNTRGVFVGMYLSDFLKNGEKILIKITL